MPQPARHPCHTPLSRPPELWSLSSRAHRRATVPGATSPPASSPDAAATAWHRREAIWERVEGSRYATLPPLSAPMASPPRALAAIGRMLVDPFYRRATVFAPYDAQLKDIRPSRQKLFHTFGSVAKATYEPEFNHGFGGIFSTGALCLIRLSLASDDRSYVPGVAIKFFGDAKDTVNVVAVPSLDGQVTVDAAGQKVADRDFFARAPTTSFPPAQGPARLLERVLGLLSGPRNIDPRRVSLQQLASPPADASAPAAPRQLSLRSPTYHFASDTPLDFRAELEATCCPGEALYEVWHDEGRLGLLRLESRFVASEFGDRRLAFEHRR